VPELAMAALGAYMVPSIDLDEPDDVANFHPPMVGV
jgi:hypothetical protein